eukprot:CAMPEP_0194310710 /NCGR_PEP_ID=MMETSP0171-20130528/7685_1 /TAXON_ID=218684 /ORGANISM="Corethron pennatum, Strain L29A3" /LENGTH=403 /DNA_ID=CAMNT_0039064483 /DNA_START=14 /DNA_END=1225 /DNA_ORIENTATION=-
MTQTLLKALFLANLYLAASGFAPSFGGGGGHPLKIIRGRISIVTIGRSAVDNFDDGVDVDFFDTLAADDDDEEEEEDCSLKGFGKSVFLVSDNMGTLAKTALQSSLAQFESCDDRYEWETDGAPGDTDDGDRRPCDVRTRVFSFVNNEDTLATIVQNAGETGAMLIFTMANPDLRALVLRLCAEKNVRAVDLLGPTLTQLAGFLGRRPAGLPQSAARREAGRRQPLSDRYYGRIEAVEFTLQADDGRAPWMLADADVVLVGVSRTGKTPLSLTLCQTRGLKVANVPLVLQCAPPPELLAPGIDPRRVFCLTLAPSELRRIRASRLERRQVTAMEERMGGDSRKSDYADRAYIMNDLRNARDLAARQGWTQVDVTGRAVEETTSYICEMIDERFQNNDPQVRTC